MQFPELVLFGGTSRGSLAVKKKKIDQIIKL